MEGWKRQRGGVYSSGSHPPGFLIINITTRQHTSDPFPTAALISAPLPSNWIDGWVGEERGGGRMLILASPHPHQQMSREALGRGICGWEGVLEAGSQSRSLCYTNNSSYRSTAMYT